jgi:penicillin-binding protein 1A
MEKLKSLLQWSLARKWKIIIGGTLIGVVCTTALLIGAYVSWSQRKVMALQVLGSIEAELKGELTERDKTPLQIFDRNGTLIGEMKRAGQREIRADNLKQHEAIIWALLASEDRNFYHHGGVQFKSIARALFASVRSGDVQGGSTITQQLAKLILSEVETAEQGKSQNDTTKIRKRSIFNKLSEFYCTWFLESKYDKPTILAIYLNKVYLGMLSVGFEDASWRYFGRAARNLSLAEAAMLVGIVPAPSLYNPAASMQRALARQKLVLKLMAEHPYVVQQSRRVDVERMLREFREEHAVLEKSAGEKTLFSSKIGKYYYARNFKLNRAPDFLNEVEKFLHRNYTSDDLKARVLRVDTTLDVRAQEPAAKYLAKRVGEVRATLQKEKQRLLAKGNASAADTVQLIEDGINGSYVGLNPENGYIESLVGGYEYKSSSPINRAFSIYRQPGSTIKALVYALALQEKIINPSTIVEDKAIKIGGYSPKNWYKGYKGKVTARQAFALSMNTVPVTLLHEIGIGKFSDTMARAAGLTEAEMAQRIGERKNLAMALGAIELSPVELARIYATIASGGYLVEPVMILKVTDFDGNAIYSADLAKPRERLLDPVACAMVMNLMQAVISNEGTMPIAAKEVSGIAGGKTGTVQSPASAKAKWNNRSGIRDTWFVGALPQQISVIWVGHERGAPFTGSGSGTAGAVWKDFSKEFVQLHPENRQLIPNLESGFVRLDICGELGLILKPEYACKFPVPGQIYFAENEAELNERTATHVASLPPEPTVIATRTDAAAPPVVAKPEMADAGAVELDESSSENLEMYQ